MPCIQSSSIIFVVTCIFIIEFINWEFKRSFLLSSGCDLSTH